jgi:hypothetical protein
MSEDWTTVNTSKAEKEEDKVEFEIEGQEEEAQVNEPIQVSKEGDEPEEVETKAEVQEESSKGDEPQSGAQKRIRQLVKQKKEREEQIQQLMQRQQELEERLKSQQQELKTSLEKSFESAEEQINSRIAMAKDAYRQALESGDTDRIVMAQEALSNAQTDASTLKIARRYEQPKEEQVAQQQVQQPQQQQQSAQYDRLAVEWAGRNPWFGQDNVMTTLALEVDAELKAEGYDPSDGDFYEEIDSRLKAKFPQRFSTGQEPSQERQQEASNPAQVVGGASRTSTASQSGKKVRLTKEDIRLAEKWGIPLEQYAAEKLKVEKAEGEYTSVQF